MKVIEGKGKYIWEDGDYYIGEFKDGLKNGKGTSYYSNGKIKYEGNFLNNKFEGKGKYIFENGDYQIGEWKGGLKNGKGTEYYSNGKINMKVISLMVKRKELENIFGKMVGII